MVPVIKHLPGHGRARVDSHLDLPRGRGHAAGLAGTDFAGRSRACADLPLGMTAHVVFTALDPERPATTSPTVIAQVIRGALGFQGLLLSDDLAMEALAGAIAERATAGARGRLRLALLHCNGKLDEMAGRAARPCRRWPRRLPPGSPALAPARCRSRADRLDDLLAEPAHGARASKRMAGASISPPSATRSRSGSCR